MNIIHARLFLLVPKGYSVDAEMVAVLRYLVALKFSAILLVLQDTRAQSRVLPVYAGDWPWDETSDFHEQLWPTISKVVHEEVPVDSAA